MSDKEDGKNDAESKINQQDISKGINYKDDIYNILALRIFTINFQNAKFIFLHIFGKGFSVCPLQAGGGYSSI